MDSERPKRIRILGVPVDCVDMPTALDVVDGLVATKNRGAIIAVNPEKVIKARQDPVLMRQLESAALLIPDGIGVVLAAKILGLGNMGRVPGADLMPAICERAAASGTRVFLFGAQRESNEGAVVELRRRFPDLQIAGSRDGYVADTQMAELVHEINESRANVLFIALGSPRQELWIDEHLSTLGVSVCQGVGGTFDVLAGRVKRAPKIWQTLHLEWAYRLLSQPQRLLRQKALPRFVWLVIRARLSSRAFS